MREYTAVLAIIHLFTTSAEDDKIYVLSACVVLSHRMISGHGVRSFSSWSHW